jgi:hypothetical protein
VTLRVGTQLVGLRADTAATRARLRALFAGWLDDDHPAVPWAFDVRLDPTGRNPAAPRASQHDGHRAHRGPRPVPQLRLGQVLMARSRDADDVLHALASVLGGVLARQDASRVWSGMRTFAGADRIVLVDAQPPALTADPALARAGIGELPTWSVAIDGSTVHVPPPLDGLDWAAADLEAPSTTWRTAALAGIVALDPAHDREHDDHDGRFGDPDAGMLSRFGVRHPSTAWFSTVHRLIRDGQVTVTSDPTVVRRRLVELIGR